MGTPIESICVPCGQPNGAHLPVCPAVTPPPVAPAPAETPEQQEHQHDLGQAI